MTNSVKLAALAATLAVIAATLSGIDSTPAPGRVWRTATPVTNAAFSNGESMRQQFPKLPITFEENRGQTDKDVRYFAQGPHYAFFLTQNEVRLSLARASNKGIVLGLRFLGLNPSATVIGAERAPGNVNYLHGNDPADWHTDVPTYSQVVYHELWPHVDLSLREKNGALLYEFRVRPGARVEDIRLAYRGADRIALDRTGGLQIETAVGTIQDSAPLSYQEIGGVRVPVDSSYILLGSNMPEAYGFRVGANYRADQDLIIDPGVQFSTFLGGSSEDTPAGIVVDAAGNSYVVGTTQSSDYPTTVGAFSRAGAVNGVTDVFVAKINPTGTALVYSTFLGGSNFDTGRAIAIDSSGNAYIAGSTMSTDFPTTRKSFDPIFNIPGNCPRCGIDNTDGFVTKLNSTGSGLVYSTFLGGAQDSDDVFAITVDAAHNAYVTGETGSADFPVTPGAFRTTKIGAFDAFVTKLNAAGSALVYSTFIGGTAVDFGVRIKVDSSKNAYVLGNTSSLDFPVTPGTFSASPRGSFDIFVLKLNATGSSLIYSTCLGGTTMDLAGGLAVDSAGNAYVSGGAGSSDFPTTPGAFQTAAPSGGGFVAKLNPTGSSLVYSTYFGDSGTAAFGLAITPAGNVWIAGSTTSETLPTTPDAFQRFIHPGTTEAFLTELNATGSALLYSTYLGGSNTDYATDVTLDSTGNVFVTGVTQSSDFPVTPNVFGSVFNATPPGFAADAFITKFALNGTPPPPPPPPTLESLTAAAGFVAGGSSVQVTATLTTGAQGSGAVVSLTSSNPAVLSVPATVTLPTGAQSGTFTANTTAVTADTPVTITASFNNSSSQASITVQAPPPPAILSSVGMFPGTVTGGNPSTAIVGISNPAPAGGFTATLSSSDPAATVPPTITVPAGWNSGSVSVSTAVVAAQVNLKIVATAGGITQFGILTINPVAPPVGTATLGVTATGRSGQQIASNPAGINVTVGSSQQASFSVGTAITLSVVTGRSAIWSGACSSGNSDTQSCTFVLNGAASVTANVQ